MPIIEEIAHGILKKIFEKRKEQIIPSHEYLTHSCGQKHKRMEKLIGTNF